MLKATDRELKIWLNHNCSQGNNWITQYKLSEITSHGETQFYQINSSDKIIPMNNEDFVLENLSHIYFTYMTDREIMSLIETRNGQLYFIHNTVVIEESDSEDEDEGNEGNEDEANTVRITSSSDVEQLQKTIDLNQANNIQSLPEISSVTSKIYQLSNIRQLVKSDFLSRKQQKALGLRHWLKCKLKRVEKDQLNQISYLDFFGLEKEAYLAKFNQFIKQSNNTLNLTHNYSIHNDWLNEIEPNKEITQLIMQQNFQIKDFSWLKKFPNLRLLNFWYCQQIEFTQIEQICQVLPELEVLNIHYCCRVNLRIMIPILKLKHLQKLAIDDQNFWCQKSPYDLFVMPDEWKSLYCPTLEKLAINSQNLTLDVADYILNACPNLSKFLVDEGILKMINRNSIGGYEKDKIITFHSWQNPHKGLQIHKQVTFKNMCKDRYNEKPFSDAMLKRIQEHMGVDDAPPQSD